MNDFVNAIGREETKRELVGVAVLTAIRENKDCFEIFYQAVKEGYEQQQ